MSKFIDKLMTRDTGRRHAVDPHVYVCSALNEKSAKPPEFYLLKEYEFKCVWCVRFNCREEDVEFALANTRRRLMEDVYGEFYGKIMDLEKAFFEWDRDAMSEIIHQIKEKIHS